jgi:hypothetical protein
VGIRRSVRRSSIPLREWEVRFSEADRNEYRTADGSSRTRAVWTAAASLKTDDASVQEIFDHARFGLPAMVADNGVLDAGLFEYGAQWVRDTSNTLLGLLHAGHFEQVRRGLIYLLEHMGTRSCAPTSACCRMAAGRFTERS